MLTRLYYRLRLFSFLTIFFFFPFDIIRESFLKNNENILKNYLMIALLYFCAHKLVQLLAGSIIQRKTVGNKTRSTGQNIIFFFLLFVCIAFIICPLTILRYYNSDVIFYLLLSMLLAKILEVIFEEKKVYVLHIIFVVFFDTLAGVLSFQLFSPSNLISSFLFSIPLAIQNSTLYVASYLKAYHSLEKNKKIKNKKKKSNKLEKTIPIQYPKFLVRVYPVLTISASSLLGIFIILNLLSIYYYLVFLAPLFALPLFSAIYKLSETKEIPTKFMGKTASICLFFILMLTSARILTGLFPF